MSKNFAEFLTILGDETQPLPVERLVELSDLDPSLQSQLQRVWPGIEPSRRRSLMLEIGQLADLHFEYNFEGINRFALNDEFEDVRRIAIENLWECEDISLATKLLSMLHSDSDPSVRAASASVLAAFVYRCEVSDLDTEMLRQLEDALLHTATKDSDVQARLRALEALGHSSRAEVPSLIQQAYDVADDDHKNAALLAMGRSASNDWANAILAEFHNAAPPLRAQAAHAAGEIELRNALPELIDLLTDVDSDVCFESIWSLGQISGSSAIQALTDLLENTDDAEEAAFIDEALDHAIFVDSTRDLVRDDLDQDEEIAI